MPKVPFSVLCSLAPTQESLWTADPSADKCVLEEINYTLAFGQTIVISGCHKDVPIASPLSDIIGDLETAFITDFSVLRAKYRDEDLILVNAENMPLVKGCLRAFGAHCWWITRQDADDLKLPTHNDYLSYSDYGSY